MIKVKLLSDIVLSGKRVKKGESVDVDQHTYHYLVKAGLVKEGKK